MAVHLFSGRILSKSLAASLVVSLAVSFATTEPTRAGHVLTHRASTPVAEPAGPIAVSRAATLFKKGAGIDYKNDANIYLTPRNIPENDQFLGAYKADWSISGRAQSRLGEASALPGLLDIANQVHRAQDSNGLNDQAYYLADAMRDAIWRKNTANRLKALTLSQSACAGGVARKAPSIGLPAGC